MSAGSWLSILSRVRPADLVPEPYPHLIVKNALEPEIFAQLEQQFPADDVVVDDRLPLRDTFYDYSASRVAADPRITPLWREFVSYHVSRHFFLEVVALFGDAIRSTHPSLERSLGKRLEDFEVGVRPGGRKDPFAPGADASMDCQFYVNYTRQPRAVRGPHVDAPTELFAALLYFRQPNDDSAGGDLQICRGSDSGLYPRNREIRIDQLPAEISSRSVEAVRTAKYEANTLVLFVNSFKSIHTVSTRTATSITRRHVNFCAEVPVDLFKFRLPARLRLRKTLEETPGLWRLAKWV